MSNIEGADLFYRTKNNSQLIYFPEKYCFPEQIVPIVKQNRDIYNASHPISRIIVNG